MREFMFVNCTLGELIRTAREDMGLSRTKLAEFTNITPNSMVRYEKAGTPDGKYPSALKLMKICEVLELDPRNAFDAIKNEDHLADLKENPVHEDDIPNRDRFGFRFSDHFRTDDDWLQWKHSTKSIDDLNDALGGQDYGLHLIEKRLERIEHALTKNGPDQKDPSRSMKSKNNAEAVEAASTRKPGGTDEAI